MPDNLKRRSHSHFNDYYWERLDNAAKIIPAVSDVRGSNVFRLVAVLKDEVQPKALQIAVERALKIMPAFAVKLHRGLFWYYFDTNRETPRVRLEDGYPCSPIWGRQKDGFLFRVTHFHKRINLEVFHALSDGMGSAQFMYLILFYYFNEVSNAEISEEYIRDFCDRVAKDLDEDSFARNSEQKSIQNEKNDKEPDAFHIQGYKYDGTRLNNLCAVMPTDKMLEIAHESNATMSEYICALIIYAIYYTSYRRSIYSLSKKNHPIVVSLPVNLRGMFGSTTLRNFFGHISIGVKPTANMTFDEVLAEVKERLKSCLTREYFGKQIAENVSIEKIPPIKFVPIWLKDFIIRLLFARAEKKYTITFSNMGRFQLPDAIADKVSRFEVTLCGSRTHPKKVSLCSYKNNLALSFASTVDDNSLERFIVRWLVSKGIDVSISSNEMSEQMNNAAENKDFKKPKKVKDKKSTKKGVQKI
jgi:NRPS condensation-like uncharacterized protein